MASLLFEDSKCETVCQHTRTQYALTVNKARVWSLKCFTHRSFLVRHLSFISLVTSIHMCEETLIEPNDRRVWSRSIGAGPVTTIALWLVYSLIVNLCDHAFPRGQLSYKMPCLKLFRQFSESRIKWLTVQSAYCLRIQTVWGFKLHKLLVNKLLYMMSRKPNQARATWLFGPFTYCLNVQ